MKAYKWVHTKDVGIFVFPLALRGVKFLIQQNVSDKNTHPLVYWKVCEDIVENSFYHVTDIPEKKRLKQKCGRSVGCKQMRAKEK